MIKWIPVSDCLPPFEKMVLVYLPGYDNWIFPTDPLRVCVKVVWRETFDPGITLNNRGANYHWTEFGPGSYFAHEPSHWAEIDLPPGVET